MTFDDHHDPARRRVLGLGAAALGIAASTAVGLPRAASAASGAGKTLVCLYLYGGMDCHDTLIPMDRSEHDALRAQRPGILAAHDAAGTSRDIANLTELAISSTTGGRRFGLPNNLARPADEHGIARMFERGEAAWLGSIGPLVEPVSRSAFSQRSVRLPSRLFSHNDQQASWTTFGAEGSTQGWGGQFVREAGAAGSPFATVNIGGVLAYLQADPVSPFVLGRGSTGSGRGIDRFMAGKFAGREKTDTELREILDRHLRHGSHVPDNLFARDLSALHARGVADSGTYDAAVAASVATSVSFPDTRVGEGLELAARTIAASGRLGTANQILMVGVGGFDTHADQGARLGALQGQIGEAVAAFRAAMVEAGRWNDVTLFTAADFGRTLNQNGSGTDHGWGGHHVVMGGSVRGGDLYGGLPDYDVRSEAFTDDRGRLIPTASVDQYAYTLGRWFGLSDGKLGAVLPNIANFAERDLGFMG